MKRTSDFLEPSDGAKVRANYRFWLVTLISRMRRNIRWLKMRPPNFRSPRALAAAAATASPMLEPGCHPGWRLFSTACKNLLVKGARFLACVELVMGHPTNS